MTKSEKDTVRRIVREEIAAAFGLMAADAQTSINLGNATITRTVALTAVRDTAARTAETTKEN